MSWYLRKLGITDTHPVYRAWCDMRRRCTNPNTKSYKHYGGRGISYCADWEDFRNFYRDMFPTWQYGLQLDREDNDLNYNKDNCRWVNRTVSMRNRSYNKVTMSLADEIRRVYKSGNVSQRELAERYGISQPNISLIVTDQTWI